MNTEVCRKNRAFQQFTKRFESRKNLVLEQCVSMRSMRCIIEHYPRSYQIYITQMATTKGTHLGLQPERSAIIHGVIQSFAQYANNRRCPRSADFTQI